MAEVGIDKVLGGFSLSGLQQSAVGFAQYVIWGVVLLAVAVFGWLNYQDKKLFIYPVRIFRQRANGKVKELNVFGGYKKVGVVTKFIIKMSSWKKKEMDKLPLSEFMDEDDRIYYWQVSPDAPLIQVKRNFLIEQILVPNDKFVEPSEEEIKSLKSLFVNQIKSDVQFKDLKEEDIIKLAEEYAQEQISIKRNQYIDITKPTYSPVPTDLKQQAMAEINNYKLTLGVDVNKQMAYFTIGVIALCILAIIIFYIAMNKGDIPILTK